jgi:hypothetical protein
MSNPEIFWLAFGSLAAAIGSMVTAGGLILAVKNLKYLSKQIEDARRVARGEVLLRLDELFKDHKEVHLRLRGGDWSADRGGPDSIEEWAAVERYMGFFERIQLLIDDQLIDLETFDRAHGYRVLNIANNSVIRKTKLEGTLAESWTDFIRLWRAIEDNRERKRRQKISDGSRPASTEAN